MKMTDQNFTIEAEDFDNLQGFDVFDGNNASGGQLVRANRNDVRLSTEFTGESGTYDYTISAQDETDGVSRVAVYVNGIEVEAFHLDRQSDGAGSNNGSFTGFSFEGLEINQGDTFEIRAWKDSGELLRFDNVSFQQTAAATPSAPETVVIQAEDLNLSGFNVVSGNQAEGGELIRISSSDARASTEFSGESGT